MSICAEVLVQAIRILSLALLLGASTNLAHADRPYAPPFSPAWAAPQLVADPPVAPPGTAVRISGAKFHRDVQAFYGDIPMQVLEVGDRYLVAVIPHHVHHEDFIYVVDNTGRARTAEPFALVHRHRRY